jgi:hypothetical protein
MMQVERTVAAGPCLSAIEDSLHGFREADPAELENVEGGFGWYCVVGTIVLGLLLAA